MWLNKIPIKNDEIPIWLVVSTYPSEKWWSSLVGMMTFQPPTSYVSFDFSRLWVIKLANPLIRYGSNQLATFGYIVVIRQPVPTQNKLFLQ